MIVVSLESVHKDLCAMQRNSTASCFRAGLQVLMILSIINFQHILIIRHMSGQRSKHQFGHFGSFRCENIFVCCFFFSLNHLRLRIRICLVITSLFLFLSMSLLCVPLCLVVFSLSHLTSTAFRLSNLSGTFLTPEKVLIGPLLQVDR